MSTPLYAPFVLLFVSVTIFANSDSTSGQLPSDSIVLQEKVVVTATRSRKKTAETPASVSVITREQIKTSSAKTVEDLLATQTGIEPRRSVAIGEGIPGDIIIRGIPGALAASRTLVLIDGIPTNASGTPFLIVNEIPMEAIERIEIVRGPYSSLYGANAMGGVINIITQEPSTASRSSIIAETSYPFTAAYQYSSDTLSMAKALKKSGKLAYYNACGTTSGGTEKTGFLASAGYRSIGDYLLRDSLFVRNEYKEYYKKNQNFDYNEARFFGKGKWYLTDNSTLTLHARYFQSALGFGRTKDIKPDTVDVETKGQKILIGPHYKISLSDHVQVRAGCFYRRVVGEFYNEGRDTLAGSQKDSVPTYWRSLTNDWQFESQCIVSALRGNTITSGIEILNNQADFGATTNRLTNKTLVNSYGTKKGIVNGAAYIQDEIKLFDRLNIIPVARMDFHSTFGSAFSPKLGLNLKVFDWLRLRSSAGRSFRAPSLAELYMPDLLVNPDFVVRCNPVLKPEYVTGFDGGFEVSYAKSLTLTVDVYYNSLKNLVSQAFVSDSTGLYVTHRNVIAAWSEGIETSLEWRPRNWLRVNLGNTLQQSWDHAFHVPLDYMPEYTLSGGVAARGTLRGVRILGQIDCKRVDARSYLEFSKSKLLINDLKLRPPSILLHHYNVINFSTRVDFAKRYSFTISLQNAFNAAYQESGSTMTPGRFATIKFGVDF